MTNQDIGAAYLTDALRNLRSYKKLAEEALAQTSDEDIFRLIDPEANSIAILIKHMAGNMRSRWTNFTLLMEKNLTAIGIANLRLRQEQRESRSCNGGKTDGSAFLTRFVP